MADLALTNERQRLAVHAYVEAGRIQIVGYGGPGLLEIFDLKRQGPGSVSIQDCSALHLATQEDAMLLTGDASLRDFADERQVEVHGILWILDTLVQNGTLPPSVAAEKLASLIAHGSRLPPDECEARKRRWTSP